MSGDIFNGLPLVLLLLLSSCCGGSAQKLDTRLVRDLQDNNVAEEGPHTVTYKSGYGMTSGFDENSTELVVAKANFNKLSAIFKQSIVKLKQKHKRIDLVFLVDSSSSVGKSNFQNEVKFVKKILADFTVSFNNTRVAVVTFSSPGKVVSSRARPAFWPIIQSDSIKTGSN